ncbi:MAG: sigma-70 family RNA polymerase sigma factor [Oscillospiraceae bacterium]|nr:sigma-70 family RNA polymerase sigma factor [Oscillospiraceae bacterium]
MEETDMLPILLLLMSSGFLMLRLGNVGSFPRPLKPAEEEEYVHRWVEQGDMEARNILIERNLRLVVHVMKKYYTAGEDMDDLISIGTIGLIKAINTYRPDKNVRLATYASRCIENAILTPAPCTPRLQTACMAHFRPVIGRFVCPFPDAEFHCEVCTSIHT